MGLEGDVSVTSCLVTLRGSVEVRELQDGDTLAPTRIDMHGDMFVSLTWSHMVYQ